MTTQNLTDYADLDGYWDDFYRMFGFRWEGVDYAADTDADVPIAEA